MREGFLVIEGNLVMEGNLVVIEEGDVRAWRRATVGERSVACAPAHGSRGHKILLLLLCPCASIA